MKGGGIFSLVIGIISTGIGVIQYLDNQHVMFRDQVRYPIIFAVLLGIVLIILGVILLAVDSSRNSSQNNGNNYGNYNGTKRCPVCGNIMSVQNKFCPKCGNDMDSPGGGQ